MHSICLSPISFAICLHSINIEDVALSVSRNSFGICPYVLTNLLHGAESFLRS